MNEAEAKHWMVCTLDVPRETFARLEAYAALLIEENQRQNLLSAGSLADIWSRHLADSAQLLPLSRQDGRWLDLGSGPGLPGLVIAICSDREVTLVESRKRRIEFLHGAVKALRINNARVIGEDLRQVSTSVYDTISARAFAPLPKLLALAHRFSTKNTRWLLPKGRSAQSELEAVGASWQGDFHLEPSVTDADARIIVGTNVRPIGRGKKRR